MAILPLGSFITLDGVTLFVNDLKRSYLTEPFDRVEFQHERLRTAPNSIGQKPLLSRLLGDTPAQIVIGSVMTPLSFSEIVPLNPDVLVTGSNFDNIKKKFNIVRWDIQGAPSDTAAVATIEALAATNIQQLAYFQAHQLKTTSMETEYDELIALQSETFSYLTTTGISLSGNSIEGTISNVLITGFSASVDFEVPTNEAGTSYQILRSFSLTVESRIITPLDVVV